MRNPTIVWDWVYATVGGRKWVSYVRKNYGGRRVCSAYSNVFDVCAIFFWQKVIKGYCYSNPVVTAKTRIRP